MKYQVRQRLVSVGDDFDIRDEHGDKLYFVDGKGFTFGKDLAVKDMRKNRVARIRQKLFTFAPTYAIYIHDTPVAVIKKRLFSWRTRFLIDVDGTSNYETVGNMFLYDYKIYQDKRCVAQVSKKYFTFADSYGIHIEDDADQLLMLTMAIVIDIVLHKGK